MATDVPVTDEDYAKQKAQLEARCINAEVIGELPIRDAVSRESIPTGGTVRLDPQTTNLDHLQRSRAIRLLPETKPAKADAKG